MIEYQRKPDVYQAINLMIMMVNYWDFKLYHHSSQGNAYTHVRAEKFLIIYQAFDGISNGCKQNTTFKCSLPHTVDKTILYVEVLQNRKITHSKLLWHPDVFTNKCILTSSSYDLLWVFTLKTDLRNSSNWDSLKVWDLIHCIELLIWHSKERGCLSFINLCETSMWLNSKVTQL